MKKILIVSLAALLLLALAGCNAQRGEPELELTVPADVAAGDYFPHTNAVKLTDELSAVFEALPLKSAGMWDYYINYTIENVEIAGVSMQQGYLIYTPKNSAALDELSYVAAFDYDANEEFLAIGGYLSALYNVELTGDSGWLVGTFSCADGTAYELQLVKYIPTETDCTIRLSISAVDGPEFGRAFQWAEAALSVSELAFDYNQAGSLANLGMSYGEVCEVFGNDGNMLYEGGGVIACIWIGPYPQNEEYNSMLFGQFEDGELAFVGGSAYKKSTLEYIVFQQ